MANTDPAITRGELRDVQAALGQQCPVKLWRSLTIRVTSKGISPAFGKVFVCTVAGNLRDESVLREIVRYVRECFHSTKDAELTAQVVRVHDQPLMEKIQLRVEARHGVVPIE